MLDWLWGGMILLSCLWGAMEGKLGEVSSAALAGVEQAVDLCMGLCAGICLWSGLLRLLERGSRFSGGSIPGDPGIPRS